jgi:hypothetical protein
MNRFGCIFFFQNDSINISKLLRKKQQNIGIMFGSVKSSLKLTTNRNGQKTEKKEK